MKDDVWMNHLTHVCPCCISARLLFRPLSDRRGRAAAIDFCQRPRLVPQWEVKMWVTFDLYWLPQSELVTGMKRSKLCFQKPLKGPDNAAISSVRFAVIYVRAHQQRRVCRCVGAWLCVCVCPVGCIHHSSISREVDFFFDLVMYF